MFSIKDFYDLIKIPGAENSVTKYDIVIGNSGAFGNHGAGLWVVNILNSTTLARPKRVVDKISRIVKQTFQLDFYISIDTVDEYVIEAEKMKTYLFSPAFRNRLKDLDSEILTPYSDVNFSNEEFITGEFINRANFTIQITSYTTLDAELDIIKDIQFDRKMI